MGIRAFQQPNCPPKTCQWRWTLFLHIFDSLVHLYKHMFILLPRKSPRNKVWVFFSPQRSRNVTSFFTFLLNQSMHGWDDRSRSSGRKASKQESSKSMVASHRKAASHSKGCGQKQCKNDTQAAELRHACREEDTGGQHNSEISTCGKGQDCAVLRKWV